MFRSSRPRPRRRCASTPASKNAPHAKGAKVKTVARAAPRCKVAPADEYFGKLKLSILGIRNTIKDQGLKVDIDPNSASSTFNAIALTEDAIRDWEHKYPCDSWIPGSIFALEHYYTKIHTADGVRHVHATFAWLRHDFPKHRLIASAKREDGSASAASPPVATDPGPPPPAMLARQPRPGAARCRTGERGQRAAADRAAATLARRTHPAMRRKPPACAGGFDRSWSSWIELRT